MKFMKDTNKIAEDIGNSLFALETNIEWLKNNLSHKDVQEVFENISISIENIKRLKSELTKQE